MNTIIDNPNQGRASGASEEFSTISVLTGNVQLNTIIETVNDAQVATEALPQFSVVKYNNANELVLAQLGDQPCGITAAFVPAGITGQTVGIFRSGRFNPKVLNFHPSFVTDEQKERAFQNFPTISLVNHPQE